MPGRRTSTSAREKAGAWPQLTIPPTAPSRPIEATSTERPPLSSTVIEIIVGPTGNRLDSTCVAALEHDLARARSTMSPNGSISARASRENVDEQAIACEGLVGPAEFVGCGFYHLLFLRPARMSLRARPAR